MIIIQAFKVGEVYSNIEIYNLTYGIHYQKEDFEEGNIKERIDEYESYKVNYVPLEKIEEVSYWVDEDSVEEFKIMPIETMPPIILGEKIGQGKNKIYYIIDGGHRITMARELKLDKILAFIPVI